MPDYGHHIRFGSFITPVVQQPHAVVALAQTSETAGLDLVTFQDHPYQPDFLDTWTLMSYIAARTDRITLSGNVLNLPLRQPAVLARSVASLDLLTKGRIELGIGAGGFWDAIEAMGGTGSLPDRASMRWKKRSTSFGASGMPMRRAASASKDITIGFPESAGVQRRHTPPAFGSAHTSVGCCN